MRCLCHFPRSMNAVQCDFLFGSGRSVCSQPCVIKRLHLATRGVGDNESLVRALVEYRCSHRYVTEGSKVLVQRRPPTGINTGEHAAEISSCIREADTSIKRQPDPSCDLDGCNNGISDARSNNNGANEHTYRSYDNASSGTDPKEEPVESSIDNIQHKQISPTQGSQESLWTNVSRGSTFSSSFFRSCSAAFDLTLPLANHSTSEPPPEEIIEYIIVKCEPSGGYIDESTVFYADDRLPVLRRVELLWDVENDSHTSRCVEHFLGATYVDTLTKSVLMREARLCGPFRVEHDAVGDVSLSGRVRKTIFLKPPEQNLENSKEVSKNDTNHMITVISSLFQSMFKSVLSEALSSEFRVFYPGQTLIVRDLKLFVAATSPCRRPGIISPSTEVYIGVDTIGECTSVSVAPLRDTLPKTYEYNLLKDCVEPYFRGHRSRTFHVDDVFMFGGVQFRVISLERSPSNSNSNSKFFDIDIVSPFRRPERCGRVGSQTIIYVNDPVDPQLTDLLTDEHIRHLRRCAPNQRELLLFKFASQLDVDSIGRLYAIDGDDGTRGMRLEDMTILHDSSRLSTELPESVQQYNIRDGSIATDTSDSGIFEDICTVCCDMIDSESGNNIFTYQCGHRFHNKCANKWISMCGTSCPNCRHRQFDTPPTLNIDGIAFSTLSESDRTGISSYIGSEQSHDAASASSDSELLRWFNSQEI